MEWVEKSYWKEVVEQNMAKRDEMDEVEYNKI